MLGIASGGGTHAEYAEIDSVLWIWSHASILRGMDSALFGGGGGRERTTSLSCFVIVMTEVALADTTSDMLLLGLGLLLLLLFVLMRRMLSVRGIVDYVCATLDFSIISDGKVYCDTADDTTLLTCNSSTSGVCGRVLNKAKGTTKDGFLD